VNEADRAALSVSHDDGLPDRLWAFSDVMTHPADRPVADLTAGFSSVGFIRAALRRSAWLWCATTVIGLLAGVGLLKKIPPPYQASVTILLGNNSFEQLSDAALDDQAILQSRTVAADALRKLGIPPSVVNPESFTGRYTAVVVTNRVLEVTVKATSWGLAVREANALAAAFLSFQAGQLVAQDQLINSALQRQVNTAQQQVSTLGRQIARLRAQPASAGQHASLDSLLARHSQAAAGLTVLRQATQANAASTKVGTTTLVKGSRVLDPAAPLPRSRKRILLEYLGGGLIAGLVVGVFFVIIRALISDKLRRRDDVARALRAPVRLSMGKVRLARAQPGPRALAAAESPEIRRIVAHLGAVVPARSGGIVALAVVPVDEPQVAALSLASLALTCAEQGLQVIVADLSPGAQAGRLLDVTSPGVHQVRMHKANLLVAIPEPEDVVLAGPLVRASPQVRRTHFTGQVAAACTSADLLLTLAGLDPSLGGEHLAGWARSAVVFVTAGKSSAARIHAVGEMIRLSGTELTSAVLIGADSSDESLGVVDRSGPLTPAGPGLG
jgi:capsular polysaccharide biosynthesis protein